MIAENSAIVASAFAVSRATRFGSVPSASGCSSATRPGIRASIVEELKLMRDGSVYDQAAENYNAIARRRELRFMQMGALPGLLCLVSSANYPGGLTDRKRSEAKVNPMIYVYEKRIWEIRPAPSRSRPAFRACVASLCHAPGAFCFTPPRLETCAAPPAADAKAAAGRRR